MQNIILTFNIEPNITFLHFWIKYRFFTFKFLFWHQYWAKYLFFTFKILFSISKLGWILCSFTFFDIHFGTKYSLFSFRTLFWHSKLVHKSLTLHTKIYFDIRNWAKYHFFYIFDIVIRPNAALIFYSGPNIAFSQSKFKIVQNMTFFEIQNPIFRFKWVIFQLFLHAKFYFDIQNWAKYHFLHFYIQIGIKYRFFTFKFLFWHQYWAKYLFLTFKILFSISKLGWLLFFPTFFDILIGTKYRLFNLETYFDIQNWHSKLGHMSLVLHTIFFLTF